MLRRLVEQLVIAEAVAEEKVDPEVLSQARAQFFERRGIADETAMENYLDENGLSKEDLDWQIELPLRVRSYSYTNFMHKAEARFLARKNQLDRIVYSLIRVKDQMLARELYLRISAREASFADLAASHSEGPEQATMGIVGPVPLTQAHPVLAERLRTSAPGLLQEPFRLADWWLVIRLERYTPACFDASVSDQMCTELFNTWVEEKTSLSMRALKSKLPAPTASA
jgi:parvulin-like peptidyl-prolyl isomerase